MEKLLGIIYVYTYSFIKVESSGAIIINVCIGSWYSDWNKNEVYNEEMFVMSEVS